MGTVTVQTDVASFEQSTSRAITGIIYFDFMNSQFPEKDWNDFIIIVLCWWLSALNSIVTGASDNEELRFMDGPLYVSVKKLNNGMCNVECFDEGLGGSVELSGQYPLIEIVDSVLLAAKTAYSVCSRNGWSGDDLDELEKLIKGFAK